MIKKSIHLALIHVIFACAVFTVAEGSESEHKMYPLPIIELTAVVSEWLIAASYDIERFSPERGQVDITAFKKQESWQLSLLAHSPLATQITAKTNKDRQAELLWEYIAVYLRGLSSDLEIDSRQVTIPPAVMSNVAAVVCIRTSEPAENLQFSGFAINNQGHILCTAHDLKDQSRISVILHDGRELAGKVIKRDVVKDLALVLVRPRLPQFVDLHKGHNHPDKHQRLFSIGCPMNVPGVIEAGFLSGPPRRLNGLPLWQVAMGMQPGSSGSPVFDTAGNLVGMVKGRYRGSDSLGFLIPLETLLGFVNESGLP